MIAQLRALRMAVYDAAAISIQKMWRGYYCRKYIHNFYARKAYLEAVRLANACKRYVLRAPSPYVSLPNTSFTP